MRTFLVAALAAALPAFGRPSAQPTETLDRAVAAYGRVRTARATFTQTITNPLLGRTVTSKGEMVQRRPDRMLVRFTDPAGDRIVADGRWVWFYLPSTNPGQVIRGKVGRGAAGTPDITAHLIDRPRSRYDVTDGGAATISGRPARALVLVPKARDGAPFAKATIWVDDADGLIRQFETTEANEVVRRVTLTSLKVNAKVAPSLFRFIPPKGVRVVDQERFTG